MILHHDNSIHQELNKCEGEFQQRGVGEKQREGNRIQIQLRNQKQHSLLCPPLLYVPLATGFLLGSIHSQPNDLSTRLN
jgi:hypothetical protein